MSRLECTPPVIISCLAGQTTARAPPCLKRPNCRPRICSANTFSTPSATNTFPCPPRHVSTTRPRRHSCRPGIAPERELTFRPGTAIIVVTRFRFFVCPRNSTSPPPSPLPIFPPSPCFRVARRPDSPFRYDTRRNRSTRRWMRMSGMRGGKISILETDRCSNRRSGFGIF